MPRTAPCTEVRYGTLMLTGGVYFTDSLLITNTGASFLNDGGTFTITGLAQVDQGTQTVASGTTQLSSNLVVGSLCELHGHRQRHWRPTHRHQRPDHHRQSRRR